MKINLRYFAIFCIGIYGLIALSCGRPELPNAVETAYESLPEQLDFNIHVKPILSDKCYACHGPDQAKIKANLQLNSADAAYATLKSNAGKVAIDPGSLRNSEVFHRIISDDPDLLMPPPEANISLSADEKAIIIKWIEEGAEYKPHWAFIKPELPKVPEVEHHSLSKNPIDNFIFKKLEDLDLNPSKEADKDLLLRRLSFDLTGLPPTMDDIKAFQDDNSANAYEKQVDRLLASVHYAEKMTTDWMDVARYSDTYGYQVDRYRNMSPWRDWVIKAFAENMPYDQFLTWQLAGDLLPNATREQILATGFNRLHPQNMEGGIVDEEFRVENVSDRVAVLGDGILGLTLSCAKCHDHKFDPIAQKEYFEFFSFFNNINETGQIAWDKTTPVPTLELPSPEQEVLIANFENNISRVEQALKKISLAAQNNIKQWLRQQSDKPVKSTLRKGLVAEYRLEQNLRNAVHPNQQAKMNRQFSAKEMPSFTDGQHGKGLLLDGDAWMECNEVGIFKRSDPFSIGIWVNIPEGLKEGVIFHKNKGTMLHSLRGYHLNFVDGKLEWVMARTWPENAIILQTTEELPRNEWVHLMVTYDGSSRADGTQIFVNGEATPFDIKKDQLTRDIVFNYLEDIIYAAPIEPDLQIGARWRGLGIRGAKIDQVLVYERTLTAIEVALIANPNRSFNELAKNNEAAAITYYLNHYSKDYQKTLKQLRKLRTAYVDSLELVQEVMVMKEMESPRQTYILNRGVYDDYGEEVFPNTPRSLFPMSDEMPKNRLGLAQWITHKDHPLTARVAVNRYWQNYFGQGLVKTAQDFGNQGALPSHPELLDWLAVQFIESAWDVKALQKLIVMSAAYRQSSIASKELMEIDPDNKWLARGPAIRLTSEMIRDNALAASGLLNKRVGGESVYPYQPEGLWALNFDPYPQSSGEDLYRRSLYTMWRRTNPNPTLATFDQPERNVCTVQRQKTNTPLQALVLLNDPTFVEAAKVMGTKMISAAAPRESIQKIYRLLTGKSPNEKELQLLLELQATEYEIFKNNPQKSKGWLSAGDYKIDPALDQNLVAANAVVASVILNGDVSITKR